MCIILHIVDIILYDVYVFGWRRKKEQKKYVL